ncbi:hypothetical protein ACTGUS_10355, partial [Streptococcus suis]
MVEAHHCWMQFFNSGEIEAKDYNLSFYFILNKNLILFKKQKLTYNRFMKLTIEQTKELKTYLKDKTYSPFHRRLQ